MFQVIYMRSLKYPEHSDNVPFALMLSLCTLLNYLAGCSDLKPSIGMCGLVESVASFLCDIAFS